MQDTCSVELCLVPIESLSIVINNFFPPSDTHALVKFLEEDSTAIVPVSRIEKKETLEYNGSCSVRWSNRKIYKGFLLMSGT